MKALQAHTLFDYSGAISLLNAMLVHRTTGEIADVSSAAAAFYGWSRETMMSMHIVDLDALSLDDWHAATAPLSTGNGIRLSRTHRIASGASHAVEVLAGLAPHDSSLVHLIVRATGGTGASLGNSLSGREPRRIAHDFNNALTVIRGASVFLQDVVGGSAQAQDDLASIDAASDRAEALMKEMLAVAQTPPPAPTS